MVELTAQMDLFTSAAFNEALRRYAESLGEAAASVPRRAAIQLCKNFRAGTKMAKRTRPVDVHPASRSESIAGANISEMPLWITWEKGNVLNPAKRLYVVKYPERNWAHTRYIATPEDKKKLHRNSARIAKEEQKRRSRLYTFKEKPTGTRGLAKRSWGWVMHNIYNGIRADAPWQRRKADKRSPQDATSDSTSREDKGLTISSGYARICNRLDYIKSAMTIDENTAVRKAASAIVRIVASKSLRKQGGMSSAEIKASATQIAEDFKREFPD